MDEEALDYRPVRVLDTVVLGRNQPVPHHLHLHLHLHLGFETALSERTR